MSSKSHNPAIILASSSPYRKTQLEQLGLTFRTDAPEIDETAEPGEKPVDLVQRLAIEKARVVAQRHPGNLVIGSDQLAHLDHLIIGKAGNTENAIRQLQTFSGRVVEFLTAVAITEAGDSPEASESSCRVVSTHVHFRSLEIEEIVRYIARDNPLDCAGSFKAERAGVSLMSALKSDDPTAIIGLPLIAVSELLRSRGVHIP